MGPKKSFELKGDSSYRDSIYREFTVRISTWQLITLFKSKLEQSKFKKLIEGGLDRGACGQKSNLLGFVFVGCPLPVAVSMSKISHINPSFKESLLCKTFKG